MNNIQFALRESRKLLEFYINNIDDIQESDIESITHFINALNAGCECDDYNGFDCGCGRRSVARELGIKALSEYK